MKKTIVYLGILVATLFTILPCFADHISSVDAHGNSDRARDIRAADTRWREAGRRAIKVDPPMKQDNKQVVKDMAKAYVNNLHKGRVRAGAAAVKAGVCSAPTTAAPPRERINRRD